MILFPTQSFSFNAAALKFYLKLKKVHMVPFVSKIWNIFSKTKWIFLTLKIEIVDSDRTSLGNILFVKNFLKRNLEEKIIETIEILNMKLERWKSNQKLGKTFLLRNQNFFLSLIFEQKNKKYLTKTKRNACFLTSDAWIMTISARKSIFSKFLPCGLQVS